MRTLFVVLLSTISAHRLAHKEKMSAQRDLLQTMVVAHERRDYAADADTIIQQYDHDDGMVSWDEVKRASPQCTGQCLEKGKELFDNMDYDHSGLIDKPELIEFLKNM